jgi:hypothetical protein
MGYTPKANYTPEELDNAALWDLLNDAKNAEEQAANGPFYPEKNITKESLTAYAAKCREDAEKFKDGGAHKAILTGKA